MGVKLEVFTGECLRIISKADNKAPIAKIPDYSRYVKNGAVHLVDLSVEPSVLVDNTTYPIASASLSDSDVVLALKKFDSTNTKITRDELYALSYDKVAQVVDIHARAITKEMMRVYLHSLAPQADSATTPIVLTTGVADGAGSKKLTIADIISLKRKFDALEIPDEGRILVLSPNDHADLLEVSQSFANQFYDINRGNVNPVLYGFEIYVHVSTPYYATNATLASVAKKSYGAVIASTDKRASIAYYSPECVQLQGEMEMYYQEASINPTSRENVIGFRTWGLVLPKKQRAIGAIVRGV